MSDFLAPPPQAISTLGVQAVDVMGDDFRVVEAARVSVGSTDDDMGPKDKGLLRFLMENKHASPFEHCAATFLVDAPIFVAREWMRHRTQSFNEVSGRYTELEGRFYVPGHGRPMVQKGKPGAYTFEAADHGTAISTHLVIAGASFDAWEWYQSLLKQGVAKEVARMVLPVNIYSQWYATSNLRNWLNFLVLRTSEHAMYEIRKCAEQVETHLEGLFPEVLKVWNAAGRPQI